MKFLIHHLLKKLRVETSTVDMANVYGARTQEEEAGLSV